MSTVRSNLLVPLNQNSPLMAMHCTVTVIDTKIVNARNEAPWLILNYCAFLTSLSMRRCRRFFAASGPDSVSNK